MNKETTAELNAGINSSTTIKPYIKTVKVAYALYEQETSAFGMYDSKAFQDYDTLHEMWVLKESKLFTYQEDPQWLSGLPETNLDMFYQLIDELHGLGDCIAEHLEAEDEYPIKVEQNDNVVTIYNFEPGVGIGTLKAVFSYHSEYTEVK